MSIILVDMDGVIADFSEGHRRMCRARGLPVEVEARDHTTWDILDTVGPEWRDTVAELWHSPGFFAGLDPLPGAIEVLHEWLREGHKVFICTAPFQNSESCAQEKLGWVRRHVGTEFVRRTIIASDKTLVHGDFLVDDKPDIRGVATPTWEHLLFAAPHNRLLENTYSWNQAKARVAAAST